MPVLLSLAVLVIALWHGVPGVVFADAAGRMLFLGVLIMLPEVSFVQFGPLGFARSFVFAAIGWAFDRSEGRRFRGLNLPQLAPPPGACRSAAALIGHVVALGGTVFGLHEIAP